jgi:hypothetical protein
MSLVVLFPNVVCSTCDRAYAEPRSNVSAGVTGTRTNNGTENSLIVVFDGASIEKEWNCGAIRAVISPID